MEGSFLIHLRAHEDIFCFLIVFANLLIFSKVSSYWGQVFRYSIFFYISNAVGFFQQRLITAFLQFTRECILIITYVLGKICLQASWWKVFSANWHSCASSPDFYYVDRTHSLCSKTILNTSMPSVNIFSLCC